MVISGRGWGRSPALFQGPGIPMLRPPYLSMFLGYSLAWEGGLVRGFIASGVAASGWGGSGLTRTSILVGTGVRGVSSDEVFS